MKVVVTVDCHTRARFATAMSGVSQRPLALPQKPLNDGPPCTLKHLGRPTLPTIGHGQRILWLVPA
jgi:hypothetical protein